MASYTPARQTGRRRRVLIENLTAYTFLLPAGVLIFLFGVFPVLFAFFVSLHRWRRFPDEFIGLGNYERALGDFVYVAFFWAAVGALVLGGLLFWRILRRTLLEPPVQQPAAFYRLATTISTGTVNALAIVLSVRWFVTLLPVVLTIPQRIRGQERVQGLFINEMVISIQQPQVVEAGNWALLAVFAAILLTVLFLRTLRIDDASGLLWRATSAALGLSLGTLALRLTLDTISAAIIEARAAGAELPVWSQIILISAGAALLFGAYRLWTRATRQHDDRRFALMAVAAVGIMLGGYLLVAELPRALASADREMLGGFNITVMYSFLAVPFQLAIGLGLAYLLFQKIAGRTWFRMIFFMPYVMPFIATSIVFTLLFSHRQDSMINHLIGAVGVEPQKWLLEPIQIGQLVFGREFPSALAGPSLALIVIIIYTVWTYAGYATVVFLAGLGSISGELYEAARIDGASGWAVFRHITLPLLSPTTFFLSLVAIIGTFQAFTQLWIMRTPAASRSTDTVSIYIFRQLTDSTPDYGYGAALAFVLFGVILILTVIQNRIAGRRVFYG